MNVENVTPRESGRPMALCLKNGIRIYPVPYGNRFKIVIERNGKPTMGAETYPEKTDKTAPKDKPVVGVYDKIRELYNDLAAKIEKLKPVNVYA